MWLREAQITLDGDMDAGGRFLHYGLTYPSYVAVTAHAGGGLADAVQLQDDISHVTVCANDHDSVKLWTAPLSVAGGVSGPKMIVVNSSAKICDVYPGNGAHAIDALGAGNPYQLAAGASRSFTSTGGGTWLSW
jgi:hypothetical protein